MESSITIYPNNEADANLYKQLAKRLKNRLVENAKSKNKEQILDDLSEAAREVKLHMEGKIKLKTAKELLDEL